MKGFKRRSIRVIYGSDRLPDFGPYLYEGGVNTLRIRLTGDRNRDINIAWRLSGLPRKELENDWVWHHHQELGVMQLVNREVHKAFAHTGGFAIYQAAVRVEQVEE